MAYSTRLLLLIATAGLNSLARPAVAQTAPVAQPTVAAVPPATTPTPAPALAPAPSPVAQPALAPAPPPVAQPALAPAPPPGYMLVPVGAAYSPPAAPTPEPQYEMRYQPGQPIPAGYHIEERMRKGLVIAGSLTLSIPWVFSATAAVAEDFENKSGFLMVPAIGPWLMLATGGAADDCKTDSLDSTYENCNSRSDERAWLFLDGITQTAGAIMLATGIGYPSKLLVRDNVAVSFAPTPLGRNGYGLGAVGSF